MSESEAKSLEEETDVIPEADANKENTIPVAPAEDEKDTAPTDEPEPTEKVKEVTVSATKTESDPPADAAATTSDDMGIYTEDKLYDDIKELIASKVLDPSSASKKLFRAALAEKYGIDGKGKMFKKHDPFNNAIRRISTEVQADLAAAESAKTEEKAKKKKKNKKSRKRKRPSSDQDAEEEAEDEESTDPPTKKRRTNDGGSVVDGDDADGADGADKDDGDESAKNKKDKKSKSKKKGKQPYEHSLLKLKKLVRAVGLANPKMYGELKAKSSNKNRVQFLKELLSEHNVPTDNLSESNIKKLKEEYALKREMADLGIGCGADNGQDLAVEDGVPLSTRRPRRNRNKVDYRQPAPPKYDAEDSGKEENDGEEYEAPQDEEDEQESEESDVYEPSGDEDDDE